MQEGVMVTTKRWLCNAVLGGFVGMCSVGYVQAEAGVLEEEGMIRLVATLKNNPAFTNVVWKVYRVDDNVQPIKTIPRHTATLRLSPGNYRAVAYLNNKRRSQNFSLKANAQANIVISMD